MRVGAKTSAVMFLMLAFDGGAHGQSKTAEVSGTRPVLAAIREIRAIYRCPVSYEDPVYENQRQVIEAAENVSETPGDMIGLPRQIELKSMTIAFTYRPLTSESPRSGSPNQPNKKTQHEVTHALQSALKGYSQAGGPETFSISHEGCRFRVVATNFLNKKGTLDASVPILETRITILPKQRSRRELFSEICESLSKTSGIHVSEGFFPYKGLLAEAPTTISGSNASTRSFLDLLASEMSAPMVGDLPIRELDGRRSTIRAVFWEATPISWELLYGPGWGYALNLQMTPA